MSVVSIVVKIRDRSRGECWEGEKGSMGSVSVGDNEEEGSGNVDEGLYTTQTYLMVHAKSG